MHKSVSIDFGGDRPPLNLCAATSAKFPPVELFKNLSPDCTPIAVKSRRYSSEDKRFIEAEYQRMLNEDVIEPSHSPWRAQVVVVSNERKRRLVVDFSQTINKYTELDAFPLPRIDDIVNEIAKYRIYSVIDLQHAYDQVEIVEHDHPFTAFQAGDNLYQFKRIPQGVTNAVASFQRTICSFIKLNRLECTFSYLDDIIICGSTQHEHDKNLSQFMKAAVRHKLIINKAKCKLSQHSIRVLGYLIENGSLRPDPARLQGLIDLPVPCNLKSLKRMVGFFAYYSKWIPNYSSKIKPLIDAEFPLCAVSVEAINSLKKDISNAVLMAIDDHEPFLIETDASEKTIAATLLQKGRPVAFFSRSLNRSELRHHIVEKEAYAIIESIRRWRELLACRHFTIITDQRAVSYMFNTKAKGKVKNEKILRWRLELMSYSFDICHRPGKDNVAADTLSRSHCLFTCGGIDLKKVHDDLIHPGVQRMMHFVRSKNLPFSLDEVRKVISQCQVCAKLKPRFYKPSQCQLIKSTSPFERISIDFKGPLPRSALGNVYILTVVDEYSRFPFAFPCKTTDSITVIYHLSNLFTLFGLPEVVHTDRGTGFTSEMFKSFLRDRGVTLSHSSPYHPQGNSQCERYNGIIWNSVRLALESRKLPPHCWEEVIPDCLHSIRSLLCTSTNITPHERIFNFARRSSCGSSLPSWLCKPGPVYMRRHIRHSKHEPLVDQVELIETHPRFARVKYNGRESTVALKDLAPLPPFQHVNTPNGNSVPDYMSQVAPNEAEAPIVHDSLRGGVTDTSSTARDTPAGSERCTEETTSRQIQASRDEADQLTDERRTDVSAQPRRSSRLRKSKKFDDYIVY